MGGEKKSHSENRQFLHCGGGRTLCERFVSAHFLEQLVKLHVCLGQLEETRKLEYIKHDRCIDLFSMLRMELIM